MKKTIILFTSVVVILVVTSLYLYINRAQGTEILVKNWCSDYGSFSFGRYELAVYEDWSDTKKYIVPCKNGFSFEKAKNRSEYLTTTYIYGSGLSPAALFYYDNSLFYVYEGNDGLFASAAISLSHYDGRYIGFPCMGDWDFYCDPETAQLLKCDFDNFFHTYEWSYNFYKYFNEEDVWYDEENQIIYTAVVDGNTRQKIAELTVKIDFVNKTVSLEERK